MQTLASGLLSDAGKKSKRRRTHDARTMSLPQGEIEAEPTGLSR